jgi:hypothetical protein
LIRSFGPKQKGRRRIYPAPSRIKIRPRPRLTDPSPACGHGLYDKIARSMFQIGLQYWRRFQNLITQKIKEILFKCNGFLPGGRKMTKL